MPRRIKVMPLRYERLKEMREQRKITQEQLSKLTGVSLRQMGRYEQGETDPPTDSLARIAKELDISMDYLAGLTDEPRHFTGQADLTKDEAKLIGAFRRGDTKTLFDLLAKKIRENIKPQTVIPRRKKKADK